MTQAADLGSHLVGLRVRLRPVGPRDYAALYEMAACGENNYRWRLRGTTPDPDQFVAMLWGGVSLQFGICPKDMPDHLIGLCTLYGEDQAAGVGKFAVLTSPEVHGLGWPIEGICRFLDYSFLARSLKKLFVEVPEFNVDLFGRGLGRFFDLEATLQDYVAFAGRLWSQSFYSCSARTWFDTSPTIGALDHGK